MPQNENSVDHQSALKKWKMLEMILNKGKALDSQNKLWKKERFRDRFFTRLFDIMKFQTEQNLLFRGHRENVYSFNKGNFIELVKLMSKYDSDETETAFSKSTRRCI